MLPLLTLLIALGSAPPDAEAPVAVAVEHPTAVPLTGEVRTPRFRLRHTERAKGAAEWLSHRIEPIRDELQEVLGADWPGVTEVRLGLGRAEYEGLALDGLRPPSWAVALAWPDQNVVLVDAHSLANGDGQQTLRHELVHVALGQWGRGWPRWFQEGLAQQVTGERAFRFSQFTTLARAVSQDRVFHLDELDRRFPDEPADVEIAYAESVAFVEQLRERYGAQAVAELIRHVHAGVPFEKSFGLAFHTSLAVEEKAFRDHLLRRYPWWPVVLGGGALAWTGTSLLVVVAYLRRRRALARWIAERRREDELEDLALRLLRAHPANDDVGDESTERQPWVVTVVSPPDRPA